MTKLRILVLHRQNTAVGYYRQWCRARILNRLGHSVTWWEEDTYHRNLKPRRGCDIRQWPEQWFRENLNQFDLLIADREIRHQNAALMAGFKHYSPGMRMIVDFDDDFTNVPDWNHSASAYNPGQEAREASLRQFRTCEMVTVSTEPLRRLFEPYCHTIRRVPNLIDPADWDGLPVDPARHLDDHIRVLYGGASAHYGDLLVVRSAIEELLDHPPVKWRLICFGAIPAWLHEISRRHPGKVISLPWVAFRDYPETVAWGGFDLALAPLADHVFNESKSQIKWMEAAIQGIPMIASRVGPYARIPDGCAVRCANTHEEWTEALRSLLTDASLREYYRNNAYESVLATRTLDCGRDQLQLIVEEVMSLPRIETLEQTRLPSDPPEPPALVASAPVTVTRALPPPTGDSCDRTAPSDTAA